MSSTGADALGRTAARVAAPVRRQLNIDELRKSWWLIVQTALTAGVAWYLASRVVGPNPFYAPVVVVGGMAVGSGDRGLQVVRVAAGAAAGSLLANVLRFVPGAEPAHVAVAAVSAFLVGILLYDELSFLTSMAFASIFQLTGSTHTGWDISILIEASIGCAVALIVTQLLLPTDPVSRLDAAVASMCGHICEALSRTAQALRSGGADDDGAETLRRARAGTDAARLLGHGIVEEQRVAYLAPRRRGALGVVMRYTAVATVLRQTSEDATALVHSSNRAVGDPPATTTVLADALAKLSEAVAGVPSAIRDDDWQDVRSRARDAVALTRTTDDRHLTLANQTGLRQVREVAADLLVAAGESRAKAARGALLSRATPPWRADGESRPRVRSG